MSPHPFLLNFLSEKLLQSKNEIRKLIATALLPFSLTGLLQVIHIYFLISSEIELFFSIYMQEPQFEYYNKELIKCKNPAL